MRRSGLAILAALTLACAVPARADDPPRRRPLNPSQRTVLLSLLDAVDAAQRRNADADTPLAWSYHVFKARDGLAYLPFRLSFAAPADAFKSTAMYIRAVSRRDGARVTEEHSGLRDWLARCGDAPPARMETMFIGPGEMPVGGPASSSSRRSTQGPAEASAVLALQQRDYERQKAAAEAAKQKSETRQLDPYLFPYEEYYFVDIKAARGQDDRAIERALGLPAGEYDVYLAMIDRAHPTDGAPIVTKRALTVPDFWNDALAVSSLILTDSVSTLKAPLGREQQVAHPYTFGRAEIVPAKTTAFGPSGVLTVVFQLCNYGAPDSDLSADYAFYRRDGAERRLFNRTAPQQLTDAELPPPLPWETQAFITQSVPLNAFPLGDFELEVTVRDRLTRASAKQSVTFTVH
jgi:hypothetical protein